MLNCRLHIYVVKNIDFSKFTISNHFGVLGAEHRIQDGHANYFRIYVDRFLNGPINVDMKFIIKNDILFHENEIDNKYKGYLKKQN